MDYVIYGLAIISMALAFGGFETYKVTKNIFLLLGTISSFVFSSLAIFYTSWIPLIAGFLINIILSKLAKKKA